MDTGGPFLKGKRLGREGDHTFASNAVIKNDGALPELHIRLQGTLLKHGKTAWLMFKIDVQNNELAQSLENIKSWTVTSIGAGVAQSV
jgi:hypothetical protein